MTGTNHGHNYNLTGTDLGYHMIVAHGRADDDMADRERIHNELHAAPIPHVHGTGGPWNRDALDGHMIESHGRVDDPPHDRERIHAELHAAVRAFTDAAPAAGATVPANSPQPGTDPHSAATGVTRDERAMQAAYDAVARMTVADHRDVLVVARQAARVAVDAWKQASGLYDAAEAVAPSPTVGPMRAWLFGWTATCNNGASLMHGRYVTTRSAPVDGETIYDLETRIGEDIVATSGPLALDGRVSIMSASRLDPPDVSR